MTNKPSGDPNPVPGSKPLRLFIADDSAPIAEMLTEFLSDPGRVEVVGIAGSEDAVIEAIDRLRPDAVVLDMQLETGSGANVIRAVRADEDLRAMRVIVMSNHTSPQLKAGCLELGADDYLDKIKDLAVLAQRIGELVLLKERGGL
jgi:Response regulator containing a CheY-like receiver domain and an HTH DNA-binding domain